MTATLTDYIGEIPLPGAKYAAKIRYRQEDQLCTLEIENGIYKVSFEASQRAITPGQICVIYDGEQVVGSGVII